MSRIGKAQLAFHKVWMLINGNVITVKGKLGELSQEISEGITVKEEDGTITLERASDSKNHKAQHGL